MVQSNKSSRTFAAIATHASDALQALIQTTHINVDPAVNFVSCGSPLHEHFVPKTSLEKHLRKCHGQRRPRLIHNAEFYYGRRNENDAEKCQEKKSGTIEEAAGDNCAYLETKDNQDGDGNETMLPSLLEPEDVQNGELKDEQDRSSDGGGITGALKKMAVSTGTFYSHVQAWQRIPRAFATMKDDERKLVTSSSLCRWMKNKLNRPGMLPSGEGLDCELVDYVVGLLAHPDFCQPDRLVLELYEFLGSTVTTQPNAGKGEKDVAVRGSSSVDSHDFSTESVVLTNSQAQSINARDEHVQKRHRASYRGNVGTKTGSAAYREMIQKHMVGLSLESDRELALGGGFSNEADAGKHPRAVRQSGCNPVECWYNFTDALAVRNRSRKRQQDQFSTRRRRSRSSSNERRSVRRRSSAKDSNVHRKRSASSDRSRERSRQRFRDRSRDRSRSPRHRGHGIEHGSRKRDQGRAEYRHGRRRDRRT